MSRGKRRGDSTAPALFPFLAVLLYTIGALILILAITVTNSHASAKRDVQQALTEVKESTNVAEIVSEELDIQREHLKSNIERRRRDLADIEDHIDRLKQNLDRLIDQLHRMESQSDNTNNSNTDKASKIAEMRKEIDQKKQAILEEIEKQKKRKPAFAVIPYSGNSGTSRRPVYLECTKAGILIQPEGLLISASDLRPPLGPGNPLDSALRILRNAYQQRDATFGITQPPYPLLLVRPDGIQSYALAREAMSGWDDQFGYELIGADMDLKYPQSMPGLREQLVSTIDLAKKRQQAFVASLPRSALVADRDSWDTIDAANASSVSGRNPSEASNQSFADSQALGPDWKLIQGIANSQVSHAIQKNAEANTAGNGLNPGNVPSQSQSGSGTGRSELTGQYVIGGGSQPPTSLDSPNNDKLPEGHKLPNREATTGYATPGTVNLGTEAQPNTNQGDNAEGVPSAATTTSSGTASSGSPNAPSSQAPTVAVAGMTAGSATGTPLVDQNNPSDSKGDQTPSQVSVKLNPSASSTNKTKYVNPDGDLKPISVSAGKGWAASRAEGKATPVSRQIFLIALKDRWLLRSESEPNTFDANITMEEGPQQAGNRLAASLRTRVDSWGLSLPGGYWAPSLTIESASDAQQSVIRLQTLLEGSGIEIHVVPLKLPNRK